MIVTILIVIAAYLLGSISSAVFVSRAIYGIDIREHGSKNAGATNVLRVLGRRAAAPVFLIDAGKGFAAVMLFHLSPWKGTEFEFYFKLILTAAVVLGHIYPVFTNFRGGKGVATLAGAVMAIHPPAMLLCVLTFFVVLAITNYVSLSSITAGTLFPVYVYFVFGDRDTPLLIFGCVVVVLLIYTHRKNIVRLINGTESKIYLSRSKKKPETKE